jgi:hypothetical protein
MTVSERLEADVTWDDAQRLRLHVAREYAGHGMGVCAQILRTEFGVTTASQPNVSRWETGAIKRPGCVAELLAYCDTYGPRRRSAASEGGEVDEFDRLAGLAAGEPLLGISQQELISGMNRRLASGPPLSAEDRATYLDQLRILRLPDA